MSREWEWDREGNTSFIVKNLSQTRVQWLKSDFGNEVPPFLLFNWGIYICSIRGEGNWFPLRLLMQQSPKLSELFDIFIINCADVLSSSLQRRWIWQEMKQIRLAFPLCVCRLAALFPFDWSIKSGRPLCPAITESNFVSQAVCPCAVCREEFLLRPGCRSRAEGERLGNISSRFLLRDPLIAAFCRWPFDPRWPLDIMLPSRAKRT